MTPEAEVQLRCDYSAAAYYFAERRCHDEVEPERAWQRDITRWSFEIVRGVRPDIQVFSALLIQYPLPGADEPGQVIPDSMIVVHGEKLEADESFDLPLQPAAPLLVAEYPSKDRKPRKDNFEKYEVELEIPYYLLFYPDNEEMTLFKMGEKGYRAVPPNASGRVAVPELELEAGLLDGWVRFWFRGELLPLPGDLLRQRDAAEKRAATAEAEVARLREELAKANGAQT